MMKEEIRILLVEDEEIDIAFLKRNFINANPQYHCDLVSTVADARIKMNEQTYNAIVSDLKLPDGDAFEVLEIANQKKIPIIIVTSKGSEQLAEDLMNKGAADYLIKDQVMGEHLMLLPEIISKAVGEKARTLK